MSLIIEDSIENSMEHSFEGYSIFSPEKDKKKLSQKKSQLKFKKTILLIDDDKSLNFMAKLALEKIGYTVYVASNGEEALNLYTANEASAILLDLSMPQVNGFEICRLIRMSNKGAKVPILIMTGHTQNKYVEKAYAAGATDFIRKPVNWTVLKHRLEILSMLSLIAVE